MYTVIVKFKDLKDGNHVYQVGDIYPRKGGKATKARITELSSDKNKRKTQLIKKVEENTKVKETPSIDEKVKENEKD